MAAPIPSPTKIIALHLGYRSRAAERGRVPDHPSYFLKPVSSIAASGAPVLRPTGCELLAFEGEVALVIGTRARRVSPDRGWAHVGWVTAANDLGVYDLRYADRGSNLRSKGADGFTPLGPEYLPADGLDPTELELTTWVNGAVAQHAILGDELLFDLGYLVADLSRLVTLEPGDVVLTGTPTGSTVVQPGDVVEVEVRAGERSTGRLCTPIEQSPNELADWGAMPAPTEQDRRDAFGTGGDAGTTPAPAPTLEERLVERYGEAVAAGLRTVSTATLTSQLMKRRLNGCMLGELHPTHPEARLVGFARTLRYLPHREDLFASRGGGFNAQKRAVEAVQPGDVLVVSARGERNAGTIGDILVQRAIVRGASGIVTDGGVRDAAAVAGLDIAVYFASSHPAPLGRHHVAWDLDIAVDCAGSLVEPGDLLVGDGDGVVVLPDHVVVEVVEAAIAQEREERFILDRVLAGESVDGLYPMNAEWRARYEASDDSSGTAPPA
ncbi:fumarylacetoacetate hydrolase family protein [Desertimonas flava]|uniref:fumarylacetoacetate hydrolase family protein n=1 Tax=Desertimonas flava TaxID=2064846 RepID=UPI000E34D527|nr:fumarylacetoacetate hydrolase family protein [Desertimonas flava]